jgi:FtsZ-binding cell division protein ZapB
MRDSKSFFLLITVLVLVTISFILISIWGYHYYFGNADTRQTVSQSAKTFATEEKDKNKDSLDYVLDSIVRKSKDPTKNISDDNTDSLDRTLELKILEYRKLKSDIIEILNKKTALNDTAIVNEKVSLLQRTIDELRERNNEIVSENEQLKETVKQLTTSKSPKEATVSSTQKRISKSSHSLPLLVSQLRFAAIHVNKDDKNVTSLASQTNRLEGSFEINIKPAKNNSPKIFIVILQPDRKVLINPAHKSGIFYTPDGNKKYSTSLQFNVKKDNHKRLYFSMVAPQPIQKGKYTMQIYHGGILIGRLNKMLL